jgi:1-aminocyclopropane-1-carboxylate deaminase
MLSLAALCHERQWRFTYYAKSLSRAIETVPTGNLKGALALGMELVTLPHDAYRERITRLHDEASERSIVIAQGGAELLARSGVTRLAEEIRQWCTESGHDRVTVVTPSGTGTTALYLAAALPEHRVVTTPVVGDAAYLKVQMLRLAAIPANLTILEAPKHPFAKPHREFLALYHELYEAGLEIDLIYGVRMWRDLLAFAPEGTVLYVHSGGLLGNETMLERYRYLGMLS